MTGITMNYVRPRKTQAVTLRDSVRSLREIHSNLTDEQFIVFYSKKYRKDKSTIRKYVEEANG